MASKLDRQIAKAMREVRKRRIFQRAVAIIRKFGHESVEERSDHMRVSGSFEMTIGGRKLFASEGSFGQFHENLTVKVQYNGLTVFEATERGWSVKDVDPRRVIKTKRNTIVVDRFITGDWVDLLTARAIKREKEVRRQNREAELAALKNAERQPSRESDREIADRFGIM